MDIESYLAILPEITDTNRPFWEGTTAGELRLQVCNRCGFHRYPEAPCCPRCLSPESRWEPASGKATLWSWIVMHQRYLSAFADELPYLIAFVQLAEGPMMTSTLVAPPRELEVDMNLRVVFEGVADDRVIPKFEVIP